MDLEKLFFEWDKAYKNNGINKIFVKDGIIDKNYYEGIVWVLKDTNNFDACPINELIKNHINNKKSGIWKGVTWHNVGRATAKLLKPNITLNEAEKQKKESVMKIAILNLKKISGGAQVSYKTMQNFVTGYEDFIIKELILLNPKKVVLGGTIGLVKDIFILKLKNKEKNIYKSELFPNVEFIKAYHPGARVKKSIYFEQF